MAVWGAVSPASASWGGAATSGATWGAIVVSGATWGLPGAPTTITWGASAPTTKTYGVSNPDTVVYVATTSRGAPWGQPSSFDSGGGQDFRLLAREVGWMYVSDDRPLAAVEWLPEGLP